MSSGDGSLDTELWPESSLLVSADDEFSEDSSSVDPESAAVAAVVAALALQALHTSRTKRCLEADAWCSTADLPVQP